MPSQKLRKPHNALTVNRFKIAFVALFRHNVVDTWRKDEKGNPAFVRQFRNEWEANGFIAGLNFCSHMDVWQPWETDAERREREDQKYLENYKRKAERKKKRNALLCVCARCEGEFFGSEHLATVPAHDKATHGYPTEDVCKACLSKMSNDDLEYPKPCSCPALYCERCGS